MLLGFHILSLEGNLGKVMMPLGFIGEGYCIRRKPAYDASPVVESAGRRAPVTRAGTSAL